MNIDEIIFSHNRNQITFIRDILSQGDVPSFEAMTDNLKTFSKYMKEDENMSLKTMFLFGGWISIAAKAYKHDKIIKKKNLLHQFEDWVHRQCKTKK